MFFMRLDMDSNEDPEIFEALMMSLFLDFLMKDAMKNPSKLVPYTKEMSNEMDELLADVLL